MKNTLLSSRNHRTSRRRHRGILAALANGALAFGIAFMPGCRRGDKASNGEATNANPSGVLAAVEIEAKPINLRNFSLPEGAELTGKTSANLTYKTKGDAKSVFEFQRRQFLALGWKELPGTQVSDASATGNFTGAGYKISATVYPFGGPNLVTVMLNNHGSIDFATLPLPAGAKPLYAGPLGASFVTETPVASTIEAVRKLLMDAGWEPHGSEGDSWHYKQGLNRISARILSAPAQGGKTMIDYGGELMCGDLPAPLDAQDVRYTDAKEEVTFKTTADKEALTKFYKEKLAPTGWKQGEDKTFHIDDYDQMAYYAPVGDVIFLKIWPEEGGTRNVALEYLSKEAIVAMDKESKERKAAAKTKKTTEADQPAAPPPPPEPGQAALPKVSVEIPADATSVEKSDQRIKFHVAKGQGQAVTEGYQKRFKEAGWKEESATLQAKTGVVSWSKDANTKDTQRVFLNYADFGTAPADIKISSFGARLEEAVSPR